MNNYKFTLLPQYLMITVRSVKVGRDIPTGNCNIQCSLAEAIPPYDL
jgi:hypothetical protein